MIHTIIATARLNSLAPYTYLAGLLGRIGEYLIDRIAALLPWNWLPAQRLRPLDRCVRSLLDAYAGNADIERDLPPVGPGDGQSQRLAAR